VYSPGTLGKGFEEVMPHNDNEFFLAKNLFFPKFDDTEWFVENLWTQLR
jgi:hypothetical protein